MNTMYAPASPRSEARPSGAISTIVTGWVTRRRSFANVTMPGRFPSASGSIEASSRKHPESTPTALVSDKSEIPQLVNLYALMGG